MTFKRIEFNRSDIIYFIATVLILSCMLFFPLSVDISIFKRGAEVIWNGGMIYRDYVDIKPPLIYYMFLAPVGLLGNSEISVRIFDIILQIASCILIRHFVLTRFKSKNTANLAALIYAIMYVSLNYNNTAQSESFLAIPFMIVFLIMSSERESRLGRLVIGFLIAFCTALKYDFLIFLFPLAIYDALSGFKIKTLALKWIPMLIGLAVGLPIFFLPLFNPEIRHGFMNTLQFLSAYSKLDYFKVSAISYALQRTGSFLGDDLSVTICFLIIYSIIIAVRNPDKEFQKIYSLMGLFFIFLCITIAVENKYPPYHFIRLYPIIAVWSAISLVEFVKLIRANHSNAATGIKLILTGLIAFMILFSPIPRVTLIALKSVKAAFNPSYYKEELGKREATKEFYFEKTELSDIINRNNIENKKVVVISTGMDNWNLFIKTRNQWRLPQSVFYFCKINIPDWQRMFKEDFFGAQWVVIAKHDEAPLLMLYKNSIDYIHDDPFYGGYLQQNFNLVKENTEFILFERKSHVIN